ncbi:g5230 [Coccomyxa viridis]|uniref:G5230 protein n=1 Tax=Coccomyxa viridis TaxID=1274662 RepID=A0ABP1FSB6_9CHLO
MAEKAVSTVRSWLSKLNIKAPWKMVGVVSSPEFQTHLPKATEYRVVAPASQKLRPSVPAAETDRIYDIRYWIRDDRRSGQLVNGTNKKHMVSYTVDMSENSPMSPDEPPPTLGAPHKWKRKNVSLLDNDAGGYTT